MLEDATAYMRRSDDNAIILATGRIRVTIFKSALNVMTRPCERFFGYLIKNKKSQPRQRLVWSKEGVSNNSRFPLMVS